MPHLIQRVTNPRVLIDASTVDLVDEDLVAEFEPEWTGNGLVEAAPPGDSGIRILCGQEIGSIAVTAELWDAPPPLDPDPWQDVAEISVAWPSVVMDFGTTDPGGAHALSLPGPGTYRVRVHGRNRDDGDPRDGHDPVEEYLIQVWPDTDLVAGPLTHKQTSRLGSRHTDAH